MSDDARCEGEIEGLPFGEQFLLWTLRQWVAAYKEEDGAGHDALRTGFDLAGIADGYLAADELLTIVAHSATGSIDVRCARCPDISPDEQIFIGLIAALQRAEFAAARVMLSFWLAPAGVRRAQAPAGRLVRLMALGGLTLRPRRITGDGAAPTPAGDWPPVGDRPAVPTVH